MKTIHTTIVQDHLSNRPINKLLNRPPPDIDKKEETLPHSTRRKLSQLRTNKSPLLMTYLHKIDPANHPVSNCPLCNDPNHVSLHLFNCPDIPTTLTVWDLWTDPVGVAALLDVWGEKLGGPRAGVWDPVRAHARDGVDTTTTTITLVFPRLTFKPLLSKASFHFKSLSLSHSIVSLIRTKLSAYSNSLNTPSCQLRDNIYHNHKKERWQHRSFVHAHFNLKLLWQLRIHSYPCLCSLMHSSPI